MQWDAPCALLAVGLHKANGMCVDVIPVYVCSQLVQQGLYDSSYGYNF